MIALRARRTMRSHRRVLKKLALGNHIKGYLEKAFHDGGFDLFVLSLNGGSITFEAKA